MMKKSVSEKEFIKFFEDNANEFNLNVLDNNQLNLDTIAESCGKNKNDIKSGDVWKYIYNNLEVEGEFYSAVSNQNKDADEENEIESQQKEIHRESYREYGVRSAELIFIFTTNWAKQSGSDQKTYKPWWQHFIFVFSALTCTGIYWIIAGCQNKDDENDKDDKDGKNDKDGASDTSSEFYHEDDENDENDEDDKDGALDIFDYMHKIVQNKNKMTQFSKKTVGICFGVLNMLFLALLVCSLVFSWTIFAQIIFGVVTFCLAVIPIFFSIRMAWKDFQSWQKKRTQEKIHTQAQRIWKWLEDGMSKEEENLNLTKNQNFADNSVHEQQRPIPRQQSLKTNTNTNENKNKLYNTENLYQ